MMRFEISYCFLEIRLACVTIQYLYTAYCEFAHFWEGGCAGPKSLSGKIPDFIAGDFVTGDFVMGEFVIPNFWDS